MFLNYGVLESTEKFLLQLPFQEIFMWVFRYLHLLKTNQLSPQTTYNLDENKLRRHFDIFLSHKI